MTRREFGAAFATGFALASSSSQAAERKWLLGLNTYCLRFQQWDDRHLADYCTKQKLDAMFLQDSLDPEVMNPKHWAEVRAWSKDRGLHLETGGPALLPKTSAGYGQSVATLRKHIERAAGMGSPLVRSLLASDRYNMPDNGPVEPHMETAIKILREVRTQVMDAGIKIAIENHKDLHAWQTRQVIETAGKEFVGSYLDTGNPVFVAENPFTTLEQLGPYALTFHLRDSVVYEQADGIAVQWVPLGEGTVNFPQLLARAAELMSPQVYVYCKPITARPPVVLPIYSDEFWKQWFPKARSADVASFVNLAKQGRPWNKPHVMADVPQFREKYMDALKIQQLDHMEQSLAYCKNKLKLGSASE